MIDCTCGFGKGISEEQETCNVCGTDLKPLHRLKGLPEAFCKAGLAAAEAGKLTEAVELLSTAISLDPLCGPAHKRLGELYLQQGNRLEAGRHFQAAVEAGLADPDLLRALHEAGEEEGRRSPAETKNRRKGPSAKTLAFVLAIFVLGFTTSSLVALIRSTRLRASPPINTVTIVESIRSRLRTEPVLRDVTLTVTAEGAGIRVAGDVPSEVHRRLVAELANSTAAGQMPVVLDLRMNSADKSETPSYTVQPGDSLSSIAVKRYGDAHAWSRVYVANQNKLASPDRLSVGQSLILPK